MKHRDDEYQDFQFPKTDLPKDDAPGEGGERWLVWMIVAATICLALGEIWLWQ